jgi:hypothetical protein
VRELITLQQSYAQFLMRIIKVPTSTVWIGEGMCCPKCFQHLQNLFCVRLRICKGKGLDEGVMDLQGVLRIGKASAMSFVDEGQ